MLQRRQLVTADMEKRQAKACIRQLGVGDESRNVAASCSISGLPERRWRDGVCEV